MEIERKYLITTPPTSYQSFPFHRIEQAYLCTEPVVRIRREDDSYYLTYKSKGLLVREEYNLPLTAKAYAHLLQKADGNRLTKRRYLIPLKGSKTLTIELDVFEESFEGLILAEVEFSTEKDATEFVAPDWFGKEVTFSGEYQNSRLSRMDLSSIPSAIQKSKQEGHK
ncbi:MAG: CYTH domain-containing protein [Hungatella sp.]